MDNNLFQKKSMLAKLLAQENIVVEHRKTKTAYFDLKARAMILPFWKEMDGDLYDLLTGHEVGHALFTPEKGWHDAVVENRALKTYLNVIEDARIERLIKDKFPGLRKCFNNAYKKLADDDFFALKGLDVSKLKLIDRINVFYKLGAHVRVPFTQEEMAFIDRISAAQSWEDVEKIARDVYAYAKAQRDEENNAPKPQNMDDDIDQDDEESFEDDFDESETFEDDYQQSDDTSEDYDNDSDALDSDSEEDESKDESGSDGEDGTDSQSAQSGSESEEDDSDLASDTDRAFRDNESKLVDDTSGDIVIVNVPEYNREYFVDHKQVQGAITQHIALLKQTGITKSGFDAENLARVTDLNKRINPVVNYMIKEFEMRKNATQLSRAKISKSGKLDPRKLARYSMDADIFQRVSSVPQGKNHGLVIFLDLSGSMSGCIKDTFEQSIMLASFCRKTNIPYEILGFSDRAHAKYSNHNKQYWNQKIGDLDVGGAHFHIKQYLSSAMNASQHREAVSNMLFSAWSISAYSYYPLTPDTEQLSGTPLDEAVIASIDIVSEFKSKYRLDIVNSIFLTDGFGGNNNATISGFRESSWDGKTTTYPTQTYFDVARDAVYLEHKRTGTRVRMRSEVNQYQDGFSATRALIEIAQKVTGAKYTGYMICDRHQAAHTVYDYEFKFVDHGLRLQQRKSLIKQFTDNGFISSKKFGFGEYFFVATKNLKVQESLEISGETKGAITRSFMKSLNSRGLQRMFLNKFVEQLAA